MQQCTALRHMSLQLYTTPHIGSIFFVELFRPLSFSISSTGAPASHLMIHLAVHLSLIPSLNPSLYIPATFLRPVAMIVFVIVCYTGSNIPTWLYLPACTLCLTHL